MDIWYLMECTKKTSNSYKIKYFEYGALEYDRCKIQCIKTKTIDVTVTEDEGDLSFIASNENTLTMGNLRDYIINNSLYDEAEVIFRDKHCYSAIRDFRVDCENEELILM